MSVLWVLPLLVVSAGVALVALAVRQTAAAAADLAAQSKALAELGQQAADLRTEVDGLVTAARDVRTRTVTRGGGR